QRLRRLVFQQRRRGVRPLTRMSHTLGPPAMSPVGPGERLRVISGPGGYELRSDRGVGGFFSWLPSEYPNAEAVTWDGRWRFRRLGPRGWKIVGFRAARSGDQAAPLADAP